MESVVKHAKFKALSIYSLQVCIARLGAVHFKSAPTFDYW